MEHAETPSLTTLFEQQADMGRLSYREQYEMMQFLPFWLHPAVHGRKMEVILIPDLACV
jgi:hypothetical protein